MIFSFVIPMKFGSMNIDIVIVDNLLRKYIEEKKIMQSIDSITLLRFETIYKEYK